MSATPQQTFDVYRNRANPTLRVATWRRPAASVSIKGLDLVTEPSVLHSDVSEDVTTKGNCYFQLVKG
jgi:hypothetical protein